MGRYGDWGMPLTMHESISCANTGLSAATSSAMVSSFVQKGNTRYHIKECLT